MLIGLTGTYGCGKSTVADMFEEMGDLVLDADALARRVVEPGQAALQEIVEAFGADIVDEQGRLDRKAMARIVFSDAARRRDLEAIIHPRVRQAMEKDVAAAQKEGKHQNIILNVPLLYEAGQEKMADKVIVVTIKESERFRRLRQRDGASEAEIVKRLGAQWSQRYKACLADAVIENSGSLESTREQAQAIRQQWQ